MSIQFRCKHCNKRVQAPDSAGGKKGKCPACGHLTEVPATKSGNVDDDPMYGFEEFVATPTTPLLNAAAAPTGGEVPDFILPTGQSASARTHHPVQRTQMQAVARYGIVAVFGLVVFLGLGYAVHYQMNWRQRTNEAVEKTVREFEILNEASTRAAEEKMKSDRAERQKLVNEIEERLTGELKDNEDIVNLGFGVVKSMGEIREYAAEKEMGVNDAIQSLKLGAAQKAVENAKKELGDN